MQVKDLKPRLGNVNIELEVIEVGETREFQKFGNTGKVANATAKDDTGQIKVSLWNEDVGKIKAGDKIRITNGWVSEFQGEMQLSAGRLGKLEVIGQEDVSKLAAPKQEAVKQEVEGKVEALEDSDLYEEDDEW